jgi:hypothetical protein
MLIHAIANLAGLLAVAGGAAKERHACGDGFLAGLGQGSEQHTPTALARLNAHIVRDQVR